MKLDTFFSCSFDSQDKEVNDLFSALCRGLQFDLTNVSNAATQTPPNVAREKIEAADCLVAICTKRDELKKGGFQMPQAVHDEISFAFAANTPMVMFVEDGVQLAGFKTNFGTYQTFDRTKLHDPDFVEKAVKSLYELRCRVTGEARVGAQGISDSFAESVYHLLELKCDADNFFWQYSTTKKLIYTHDSKRSFSTGVWSTVPAKSPEEALPVEWNYEVRNSSHDLTLVAEIEKRTPACIEVQLRPHPQASEGDFIEYSTVARGRYINPVWRDEVTEATAIHLDDCDKLCGDGLIFIHRTKAAVLEFRFPSEYGLTKKDVRPFVGSYTQIVDYEVRSELERITTRIDDFAGSLSIRMEIDSPLLGHMYGIAWNPRERPAATNNGSADDTEGQAENAS